MIIRRQDIRKTLSTIPHKPGCYRYRDLEGTVIYVGKAKDLNRRISSYFHKTPEDSKTRALLKHFDTIEYMVVETEHDALLLEYNLIREYQPKYNILLKKGNAYPSICIKREPYPRVFSTHKPEPDGSKYFGPYPNKSVAWTLIRLFRSIYKLRTCNLKLTEENIRAGKFHVCLQYHIKRCKGPCEGHISKKEYDGYIRDIKEILNGNVKGLMKRVESRMMKAAEDLRFEEAQEYKIILSRLDNFQGKSPVSSANVSSAIAVTFGSDLESIYANYLEVHNGNIIAGRTLEYKKGIEEDDSEIYASILLEILEGVHRDVHEILLAEEPDYALPPRYKVVIPQRGDKKKLVDLSEENVRQYREDKSRQMEKLNPEQRNIQLLQELQNTIGLPTLPFHIECFDNSNISGDAPVAACVVFKGGKPSKEDYRLFHIKSVEGPDDYASMQEVVMRRYSGLLDEGKDLPDLIITDGGKGHMNTVKEALETLGVEIPLLGLAKDEKHRTANILYGDPPTVIGIMNRSPAFHLLEKIQNEVHRFAITFHRKVRSKKQTQSILDDIKGIGPSTKKKLMGHFKSIKRLREAPLEEISAVIGPHKGSIVFEYLSKSS